MIEVPIWFFALSIGIFVFHIVSLLLVIIVIMSETNYNSKTF